MITHGNLKTDRDAEVYRDLGKIAEYSVEIEAGGKGLASTRQISSVAGSLSEAISYEMATRLRVATRQKLRLRVPVFVLLCGVSWIIERGNFLCAGYATTRVYASKLRLRIPVFVLFCGVGWIMERGNFLSASCASTRGYAST